MPPALFLLHLFGMCLGLSWLASMGMFGVISYLPLYVQGALGADPSIAGFSLVLASLGWTVGSFIAAPGMHRLGYRAVCAAGMLLMAIGYGAFVAAGDHLGFVSVLIIGALIGVGMGMVSITTMVAGQNAVELNQLGTATSTLMLSRMLGGAFGIALMGSVLVSRMERQLMEFSAGALAGVSDGVLKKLADPQNLLEPSTRALIPEALLAPLVEVLRTSIWWAFLTGFIVMLIGFAASCFMSAQTPATGHGEKRGS